MKFRSFVIFLLCNFFILKCRSSELISSTKNISSTRGTICCQDLGCFSNERGTPWEHNGELPDCLDSIKPNFYLYTPESGRKLQLFEFFSLNSTVHDLIFNASREMFFVLHGYNTQWPDDWIFNSSWNQLYMFHMKDQLIKLGHNVILVKWTGGSNKKEFAKAVANTRIIGMTVAKIVKVLNANKNLNIGTTTLIGFSMGGQAVGFAGQELPSLFRIIALDPAGPLFTNEHVDARLDPTDAKFVMVIHTNGQPFLAFGLGTPQSSGHVDIYVNGGKVQPGCPVPKGPLIFRFNFETLGGPYACSHRRSVWLFIEMLKSLNNNNETNKCSFLTFPCANYDRWQSGECFKCPNEGCISMSEIFNSKNVSQRGAFYFNTFGENSTDGGYCGQQVLASFSSKAIAQGSMEVTFVTNEGNTSYPYQTILVCKDGLQGGEQISKVIVAPFNLKERSHISLLYNKCDTNKERLEISKIEIVTMDGSKWFISAPVTVSSNVPTIVEMLRS